jgi:mannosyltransferase OCH1-like enzyme
MTKNSSTFQNKTQELHLANRRTNPDIDYQLWDDNDVENFMKKEYAGEIYDAYSSINAKYGAARGDFFRYCVLYKYGGLWLDFEASIHTPNFFGRVIQEDDECLLDHRRIDLATYRRPWGYPTHENWFLAFTPKHPYLEYVIARLVRSIKRKVSKSADCIRKSKIYITRLRR